MGVTVGACIRVTLIIKLPWAGSEWSHSLALFAVMLSSGLDDVMGDNYNCSSEKGHIPG